MTFQHTDSSMPPADLPPVRRDLTSPFEPLRLTATGSPWAIQNHIQSMHHFGYAEPNDWSKPLPTGQPGEMMVILIKRIWRREA